MNKPIHLTPERMPPGGSHMLSRGLSFTAVFVTGSIVSSCSLLLPTADFVGDQRDSGLDAALPDAATEDDAAVDGGDHPGDGAVDAGCGSGWALCGASCVDLETDPSNCGACDRGCESGWTCSSGSCWDPPVRISVAPEHSCVVRASGRVFCWGANTNGQLGDGSVFDSPVPVEVIGLLDAVDVSAGGLIWSDPWNDVCEPSWRCNQLLGSGQWGFW